MLQTIQEIISNENKKHNIANIYVKEVANGYVSIKQESKRFFNAKINYDKDSNIESVTILYRQNAYAEILKDKAYETSKTYVKSRGYYKYTCKVSLTDFIDFYLYVVLNDYDARDRLENTAQMTKTILRLDENNQLIDRYVKAEPKTVKPSSKASKAKKTTAAKINK